MKRPTSVTVFGILNIVFAILGFCGIAFQLAQPFVQEAIEEFAEKAAADAGQEIKKDPIQEAIKNDPNLKMLGQISNGLSAVATVALLAAGIALLKMKSWGRTLSILYAIYDIVSKIVFAVLNLLIMMPLIAAQQDAGGPAAEAIGGIVAGSIGCGLIFTLIYPILLLIFMLRSNVREAFAAVGGSGGDDMMQIPDDTPYSDPLS